MYNEDNNSYLLGLWELKYNDVIYEEQLAWHIGICSSPEKKIILIAAPIFS